MTPEEALRCYGSVYVWKSVQDDRPRDHAATWPPIHFNCRCESIEPPKSDLDRLFRCVAIQDYAPPITNPWRHLIAKPKPGGPNRAQRRKTAKALWRSR